MGVVAAWFFLHVALYVHCVYQFDPLRLGGAWCGFFGWQATGFLATALIVKIGRPRWLGTALSGYLAASTVVLLGFAHEPVLIVKFFLLLLWLVCAANGLRRLIERLVGQQYATWGVALAAVYAVLIPVCFFLGIARAIAPPIVGVVAILTALPGAIDGLRRLPTLIGSAGQRIGQLGVFELLVLQTIWFLLAIALVSASTTPILMDAPRVHIPYIHQVVADHGMVHHYPCWHRLQPMAMQTCCAAFAAIGSDIVGTWFSWLALTALVWLIAEEVFRRSGSLKLGLFAGAAALGCPLLLRVATSHQIDHAITLLCTAGFIVLFRALSPPHLRGILFSAAIMGSMVQVKYTGMVFAVVWGAFSTVALLQRCNWRVALRWSIAAGALFVAAALPWYVYGYVGTGNPFYPYLHSWFPSPHWPDGYTLQAGLEKRFSLEPGIAGVLSFPWGAAYETHRYVEGHDGFMGFWIVALAPCWFFAKPPRAVPYWDMAIVGVAMIAGILFYTPYTRYWMPACPLLTASCFLAFQLMARSVQWRPQGRMLPALAKAGLIGLLLLPAPLACLHLPDAWAEYTKQISTEERSDRRFQGYQAIERLNAIRQPNEGVLCTDFEGVYQIRGRAYAFSFWLNDIFGCSPMIHGIHDVDSFDAFRRRHGIRYWVVGHYPRLRVVDEDPTGLVAKYWTDARIAAASGTVTVYDLGATAEKTLRAPTRYEWPTALRRGGEPWSPEDTSSRWIKVSDDVGEIADEGVISLTGSGQIAHRLPLEPAGRLCKIEIDFWSGEDGAPCAEIIWFDGDGNTLNRTYGKAYGSEAFRAAFYSLVPPGAKAGWIRLWEYKGRPIRIKRAVATFWDAAPRDETAGQGKQAEVISLQGDRKG